MATVQHGQVAERLSTLNPRGSGGIGSGTGTPRQGMAPLVVPVVPLPSPLSLGVLTTVFAGTSAGLVLRDHVWVAGTLITVLWVLGTGYGLRLIRQAERANGACPVRTP